LGEGGGAACRVAPVGVPSALAGRGTAPAVSRSPPPSRAPFSSPIRFRVTWLGLPSAPEPLDFRPTRSVGPRRCSGTPGLFATHINILANDPCHTILPTVLPSVRGAPRGTRLHCALLLASSPGGAGTHHRVGGVLQPPVSSAVAHSARTFLHVYYRMATSKPTAELSSCAAAFVHLGPTW